MCTTFKKDIHAFFASWLGWMLLAVVHILVVLYLFFLDGEFNIFLSGYASMQNYFVIIPWVLMLITPTLAMKCLTEEKQAGTFRLLMSMPISVEKIIFSKYLFVLSVACLSVLPSIFFVYGISQLSIQNSSIDVGIIFTQYLGLFFLILSFSGLSILASSIVKQQISAFILGVLFCFVSYYIFYRIAIFNSLGLLDDFFARTSIYQSYISFGRGVIEIKNLAHLFLIAFTSVHIAVRLTQLKDAVYG